MDKIQAWQLFGIPFVLAHPEIFPEEASRGWYRDSDSSSPLPQAEDIRPDKATVIFEVKVGIRRVQ